MTVIEFPASAIRSRPTFTAPIAEHGSQDQIFAAIARHYAAYLDSLQDYADDDDMIARVCRREIEALTVLMKTTPTTVRGCAAMLRYFSDYTRAIQSTMLGDFTGPLHSLGENFPAMIADVLEQVSA